jgi:hypothetical protein
MGVVSIGSKIFLGGRYPRGENRALVPDGVKFIAGVMLTLLLPTLLYCAASGQLLPLCLMAGNEVLGGALGVFMFLKSSAGFTSCVPVTCVPNVPSGSRSAGLKRAA